MMWLVAQAISPLCSPALTPGDRSATEAAGCFGPLVPHKTDTDGPVKLPVTLRCCRC